MSIASSHRMADDLHEAFFRCWQMRAQEKSRNTRVLCICESFNRALVSKMSIPVPLKVAVIVSEFEVFGDLI